MESFTITSKKVLTLVLVIDKAKQMVLLGYKKRGFGAHLWNGFGGKVEPGETAREGALRELEEEAGITVKSEDFKKAGILLFQFENDPVALETHVYKSYEFQGQIRECEEMRPQWFAFADVPYDQMWEDDQIWLPMLLNGQDPFYGRIYLKRKPVEDLQEEETTVVVNTSTSTHVNHSTTMTGTSFTIAQPKSGPFAMWDYQLEHSLQGVPHETALDGTIASFEN
ncbi:Nudix (Nucleoside diphosphate linked moiety X)-type motif 1 [Mortierella hygrophila]|uniref:Oxidized purine nucleoside triphosphate hydrolase n=1 Tax=Mortierella hygrophila TaxID=979708 RepID=A0A9P6F7V6_9FUNG|nr:Nudix (Nucleoside diphosphate linked moiety X)-type motif 1 [Mortierella hygrophila]